SPYRNTYAVAICCSDVRPSIWSQRNRSGSDSSKNRSVAVFFRMNECWPSTRDATSASSNEPSDTRCGRDWMNATPLPIWRSSKPSWSSSRRTSSSRRARRGAAEPPSLIGFPGGPDMAPRPPPLGRAPAQPWRASGSPGDVSSVFHVEAGGLEAPPRHLGDEIARRPQPLDEDQHERLEKRGGRARTAVLELVECGSVENEQHRFAVGLNGRGGRRAIEERHLTEEGAGAHTREHLLDGTGHSFGDHERARADQEHLVTAVALTQQHLPAPERTLAETIAEKSELRSFDVAEEAHAPEKGERIGRAAHRARVPG